MPEEIFCYFQEMKYLLILLPLFLSACASVVESNKQIISVDTPNCPQARCTLVNNPGIYYISQTPGTVIVNKSKSRLLIECTKDDLIQKAYVDSRFEEMVAGNVIFGGLIGTGMDFGSGAAFNYPPAIIHPMTCE